MSNHTVPVIDTPGTCHADVRTRRNKPWCSWRSRSVHMAYLHRTPHSVRAQIGRLYRFVVQKLYEPKPFLHYVRNNSTIKRNYLFQKKKHTIRYSCFEMWIQISISSVCDITLLCLFQFEIQWQYAIQICSFGYNKIVDINSKCTVITVFIDSVRMNGNCW